jgi:hypothetical protein
MTLTQISEHIEREVREALRIPTLDAVRAIANESGIRRARLALAEAPDRLAAAQAAFREAQAAETLAKENYQQALLEAEWELEGQIYSDGNKRYRWITCECLADADFTQVAGQKDCPACAGVGKVRRNMLADDVKAWKASEAAKQPSVIDAGAWLRRCEEATAAARDAVTVADKRLSAQKLDLQAAIAELTALSLALQAKGSAPQ